MTNIRDFAPAAQEQRGAMLVQRYPDTEEARQTAFDHDELWRFSIGTLTKADGKPGDEIWLRLSDTAIGNYVEDETILNVVATELLQMAVNTDPGAALADGRKVSGLKPEDLYHE